MIEIVPLKLKSSIKRKAKRIQGQKDRKDKEAKRFTLEKAKIEALIAKHRPRTPKTPDEVSTSGTGKNAKVDGQEGTKNGRAPYKRQQRISRLKSPTKREKRPKILKRAIQTHYWVIRWPILQ